MAGTSPAMTEKPRSATYSKSVRRVHDPGRGRLLRTLLEASAWGAGKGSVHEELCEDPDLKRQYEAHHPFENQEVGLHRRDFPAQVRSELATVGFRSQQGSGFVVLVALFVIDGSMPNATNREDRAEDQ
jgi:hypothetical protein